MKIGLMLTDTCNFRCKHCMVDSTHEARIADDSVINRFYEVVGYNRPDEVCIVGGEPLLFLDKVEKIVSNIKPICDNILIYSNGTFLLDDIKRERVKGLGVSIRISKTNHHKEFWNDSIEELISNSPYIQIEGNNGEVKVFPRGRALSNNIYNYNRCMCSLVTGVYGGRNWSNRVLIMQDGSVNIWCPCMSLELANVFEDSVITHGLLVEREALLRKFLKDMDMFYDSMLFMCNNVCNNFRVTKDGIFRDGELMEEF